MQQSPMNHSLQIDLEKLPSIPHALLKLFDIIHDPEVSFTKISEIIQTDPALTTRVMSIANSGAYYPHPGNTETRSTVLDFRTMDV